MNATDEGGGGGLQYDGFVCNGLCGLRRIHPMKGSTPFSSLNGDSQMIWMRMCACVTTGVMCSGAKSGMETRQNTDRQGAVSAAISNPYP